MWIHWLPGMSSKKEMTNVQSMQNLPNCPPVHPSHQNQDSDKGSWWAVQKQRTCLQILEALWRVSMSGCLWPTVSRISLVSSESSAGRLWELSLGCKDEERKLLWDYVLCLVQLKATVALMVFNGPKWFNECGHSLADHLGTGLRIWKLASFPICSVEQ